MHPDQYERIAGPPVRLLTVLEACQLLGCSKAFFYDTPALRDLCRKHGHSTRVRSDELDAYIKGLPSAGFGKPQ